MENGLIECFNGRLRDECLNLHLFWSIEDARDKLETWREDYNTERAQSALANLPPAAFAASSARKEKEHENRELLLAENCPVTVQKSGQGHASLAFHVVWFLSAPDNLTGPENAQSRQATFIGTATPWGDG